MEVLRLADTKEHNNDELISHIAVHYEAKKEDVLAYDILVAYESVGDWGCDSSSFFLLREKKTGKLFENHGSHCSCYGFEGQWEPEETTLEYLQSDSFSFYTGGYDDNDRANRAMVVEYINGLAGGQDKKGVEQKWQG